MNGVRADSAIQNKNGHADWTPAAPICSLFIKVVQVSPSEGGQLRLNKWSACSPTGRCPQYTDEARKEETDATRSSPFVRPEWPVTSLSPARDQLLSVLSRLVRVVSWEKQGKMER